MPVKNNLVLRKENKKSSEMKHHDLYYALRSGPTSKRKQLMGLEDEKKENSRKYKTRLIKIPNCIDERKTIFKDRSLLRKMSDKR